MVLFNKSFVNLLKDLYGVITTKSHPSIILFIFIILLVCILLTTYYYDQQEHYKKQYTKDLERYGSDTKIIYHYFFINRYKLIDDALHPLIDYQEYGLIDFDSEYAEIVNYGYPFYKNNTIPQLNVCLARHLYKKSVFKFFKYLTDNLDKNINMIPIQNQDVIKGNCLELIKLLIQESMQSDKILYFVDKCLVLQPDLNLNKQFFPNNETLLMMIPQKHYINNHLGKEFINILVTNGFSLDITDKKGETALFKISKNKMQIDYSIDNIVYLLEAGANPTICNNKSKCFIDVFNKELLSNLCKRTIQKNHYIKSKIYITSNCMICLEENVSLHCLLPCGHSVICEMCFDMVDSKLCPFCRSPYSDTKLFHAI